MTPPATAPDLGSPRNRPAPTKAVREARPRLRLLAPPSGSRSPVSFTAVCAIALTAGLLGLLALNIGLAQGSYELQKLNRSQALLAEQEQSLAQQVEIAQAPDELSRRAQELGMVAAPGTTVLRLDGTVAGEPEVAPEPPPPPAPEVTAEAETEPVPEAETVPDAAAPDEIEAAQDVETDTGEPAVEGEVDPVIPEPTNPDTDPDTNPEGEQP